MKILIMTHDLVEGNAHLMPWRTVVEVTTSLRVAGHEALLLSASEGADGTEAVRQIAGVPVRPVPKPRAAPEQLRSILREFDPDILYWPFAWWNASGDAPVLQGLRGRRIGYVPGARYRTSAVLRAAPALGLRHVAPYVAQALYPDRALARGLRQCGIHAVITMTDDTNRALQNGGWPGDRVQTVWPGRENRPASDGPTPIYDELRQKIGDGRFFLFFSPPTPIRGTQVVLDAFERLRRNHADAHLVCLFRSDINVDMAEARVQFERRRGGAGLHTVWHSVSPQELTAFLAAAHAVVLPFLLVPSEIPLAVIEAAGHGAPVISTGPSGTGDFVSAYGAQVRVANPRDLYVAMDRMLQDPQHHAHCGTAATARFAACPTWDQVAQAWLRTGTGDAV
jgi:glycosyltransferase involved in cell wall biosynthesis